MSKENICRNDFNRGFRPNYDLEMDSAIGGYRKLADEIKNTSNELLPLANGKEVMVSPK